MTTVDKNRPSPETNEEQVPVDLEESGGILQSAAGLPGVLLAGTRDLALNIPKKVFEIKFELSDSREELRKKIAWIIRIRFIVNPAVFLLMLITNWQGLTKGAEPLSRETITSTGLVTIISIVLNLAYYFTLKNEKFNLRKFVFLQLVLDVVMFSGYLWRTGGITSPFGFLFFLPIIGGSILLSPATGMLVAGITSVFYILIIVLESSGVIPHVSYFVAMDQFAHRWGYIILMIIVNIFGFIVVAGASGFLMRTVQKKTKELKESNQLHSHKAKLFGMLYQVSEVLQHNKDMEEVLDRICDVLVTDMNVDRALMYIIEGEQLRLKRVAYHHRVPIADHSQLRVSIPLDPAEGLTARCAFENISVNVTDPLTHEGINVELAEKIGKNPFALAAMTYRGRVLGVLGIDRSKNYSAIGDDEFEVLQIFARQAGQTIASAEGRS
jgi:hypothetical protein